MSTIAKLLLDHAEDDRPALLHPDGSWSFREVIAEGRRRAALFDELRDPDRPPHIGVLLDNVPDYLFWLVAAALSRSVIVGINSTYRGANLAQLIDHSDCQLLVTSTVMKPLLEDAKSGVADDRVLIIDEPEYASRLAAVEAVAAPVTAVAEDLYLLVFTSGSTGLPKAVRCTQGRLARSGAHVASIAGLTEGDVLYAPLPFFHAASLFTGWSSALNAGVPIATRTKFSTSQTRADLERFHATVMPYTGKVLNYILTAPESPTDAQLPLRLAIGNEASVQDIKRFAARFGCTVRDSYGSTEGVVIIRRDESMPAGALGRADESVRVLDPATGQECPAAQRDDAGRVTNLEEAVGEIVETAPSSNFEGYYRNEAATNERFRNGQYWSGDLAYRDADGWFYFAGRSNEWLRVDGENFAAAPVEAIIARHPAVRSVAVYAVPDDPVGDRVMAALELHQGVAFDLDEFDAFLKTQADLGTKWVPAFVRIEAELPKLASMKIDKTTLRREVWTTEHVVWRPEKNGHLRPLDALDRERLSRLLGNKEAIASPFIEEEPTTNAS